IVRLYHRTATTVWRGFPFLLIMIDLLHFRPLIRKTYQNGGMSMYPRTIIDSLPAVPNRDQLTHKDLHAHFSTGQSILLSGSGRDKKYGYRNGIQTDLGDIRNDVWLDLVRELIVRSHEEDLFDKLLEWEKEHTYWLKTKAELEHYTLELYAARIFDNPKWVDYEAFAKHYGYQPQSYEG
ncbi:MAG TPA: hypothetical protein PLD42_06250, partial [Gemmiger formicilis]|nr:hypothetical protein [Gemmiger formicilis]